MLETTVSHPNIMKKRACRGFTSATDVADYLVGKGMPFRNAQTLSGYLVLKCIDLVCELDTLPLDAYQQESALLEQDIYTAISLEACVNKRITLGSPSPGNVQKVLNGYLSWLSAQS